jgi:hypothetical protein
LYDPAFEADQNLLTALLERPHDWPSEPPSPTARSERARLLIDAMAWHLATHRGNAILLFEDLLWPEPLIRLGIAAGPNATFPRLASIEIPEALVRQELPFVDQLKHPLTPLDGATQSRGMARAYRRFLFGDLERTRQVVADVSHWTYDRHQESSERISIKPDERWPTLGVEDVNCRIMARAAERVLSVCIWHDTNALQPKDPFPWYCEWDPSDWVALQTVGFLDVGKLSAYQNRQRLRDARYVIDDVAWPYVMKSMREEFKIEFGTERDLEKQLQALELTKAMRRKIMAEPWRLSGVLDFFLVKRYLYHLEQRYDESVRRAERQAPPTRTSAKADTRGVKKPAKRKKAKSPQRKRKRKK